MKRILSLILVSVTLSYSDYSYGDGDHMHKEVMQVEQNAGICPVLHEPASKEYSYVYEGKTYYFCCAMCVEEFKKDPQKYISKIKEIKSEAYQFGFSPDPVVVKKGDIGKLVITSRDVTHGVYIKEYGINVTVTKQEAKKIEFFADKAGKFDIVCSVYCGKGHSSMKGKLIVEE